MTRCSEAYVFDELIAITEAVKKVKEHREQSQNGNAPSVTYIKADRT